MYECAQHCYSGADVNDLEVIKFPQMIEELQNQILLCGRQYPAGTDTGSESSSIFPVHRFDRRHWREPGGQIDRRVREYDKV